MFFRKIKSISAVVIRNILLLIREKQFLVAPILLPLVLMFLTSIIMGAGGDSWPVAVINQSNSKEAQQFLMSIENSHSNITPYFKIIETNFEKAEKDVKQGRLQILIRIPENFNNSKMVYIQTFNINSDMMKNVRLRLKHAVNKYLDNKGQLKVIPELITEKKHDVWRVSFISGSAIILALFFGATIIAANLFAYEREMRTSKEILLNPLNSIMAGIGNLITAIIISIITSLPSLFLAATLFKLNINWRQLLLLYIIMIPIQTGFAGLGIYIAQVLKRSQIIQPVIIVSSVATFFGGGGFAGVDMLPPAAREFARYWIFSRVFTWLNPLLHNFKRDLIGYQYIYIILVAVIGLLLLKFAYYRENKQYVFSGQ